MQGQRRRVPAGVRNLGYGAPQHLGVPTVGRVVHGRGSCHRWLRGRRLPGCRAPGVTSMGAGHSHMPKRAKVLIKGVIL